MGLEHGGIYYILIKGDLQIRTVEEMKFITKNSIYRVKANTETKGGPYFIFVDRQIEEQGLITEEGLRGWFLPPSDYQIIPENFFKSLWEEELK